MALVSDRTVQINGLFTAWDKKGSVTVVGALGVRVCNSTLRVDKDGKVTVNGGVVVPVTQRLQVAPGLAIEPTRWWHAVRITAGDWSLEVQVTGKKFLNVPELLYHGNDTAHIHGVYGITGRRDHHQKDAKRCQPRNEGGCEVPGQWEEYELPIGADLTDTKWTYAQFDERACTLPMRK